MKHKWKTTYADDRNHHRECIYCGIIMKSVKISYGNWTSEYYYQDGVKIPVDVLSPECKREEFIKEEEFNI